MRVSAVTVVSGDTEVVDAVLSAAAVAGVPGRVASAAEAWRGEGAVAIGVDAVAGVDADALRAVRAVVVGGDAVELARWSAALGVPVVPLPSGMAELTRWCAGDGSRAGGAVMAVVGAVGGVGTSTVAAVLAGSCQRRGLSTALLDLGLPGPGIDLLVGAEREPGWRWPDLEAARGHLGPLGGLVPAVDGVDVISGGREANAPPAEAVAAVMRSLADSHEVVLVDVGNTTATGLETVGMASAVVGVTAPTTAGIVAADVLARRAAAEGWAWQGVVLNRTRRGALVADATSQLEQPVLGDLPHEPALAQASEVGDPPWRVGGRRWRKAARDTVRGCFAWT